MSYHTPFTNTSVINVYVPIYNPDLDLGLRNLDYSKLLNIGKLGIQNILNGSVHEYEDGKKDGIAENYLHDNTIFDMLVNMLNEQIPWAESSPSRSERKLLENGRNMFSLTAALKPRR